MSQAEQPQTLLMVLPVRGLYLTDVAPPPDLFAAPWQVVGKGQFDALHDLGLGESFSTLLQRFREKTDPTAFFFHRYHYPTVYVSEAARQAEYALSALSMAVLLHSWPPGDGQDPAGPCPVFRARYAEYYDHPVAVGKNGVKVSGGGKSVFGLLRPDWIMPEPRLSRGNLDALIDAAPNVVRAVLEQAPLNKRQRRLADGMAVINSAFQSLSPGAFVGSLVSAAEVLVDAQAGDGDGGAASWQRRRSRIGAAVGSDCEAILDRVMQARHEFVHSGAQPRGDRLPLAALGIALQVWTVMADLYGTIDNAQDVEAVLDAAAIGARVSAGAPEALRQMPASIPRGARSQLPWIDFWLQLAAEEAVA
ncbi:MAG: hypothetical protein Q8P50_07475 [Bacillota bacterium]|nr:hypothetical protein [Bacillota bacterium]